MAQMAMCGGASTVGVVVKIEQQWRGQVRLSARSVAVSEVQVG